jgi:hypothetical protein
MYRRVPGHVLLSPYSLMFAYYQGDAEYGPALQASRSSDDPRAECLASLLIAEHMLAKKDDRAVTFLDGAVSICDPETSPTSTMAAWAELKKISPKFKGEGWSPWPRIPSPASLPRAQGG